MLESLAVGMEIESLNSHVYPFPRQGGMSVTHVLPANLPTEWHYNHQCSDIFSPNMQVHCHPSSHLFIHLLRQVSEPFAD